MFWYCMRFIVLCLYLYFIIFRIIFSLWLLIIETLVINHYPIPTITFPFSLFYIPSVCYILTFLCFQQILFFGFLLFWLLFFIVIQYTNATFLLHWTLLQYLIFPIFCLSVSINFFFLILFQFCNIVNNKTLMEFSQ